MGKIEGEKQEYIDHFKAQAIETSLDIIESVKNGKTQIETEKKDEIETLYMEKVLEYLPEDVDMLCLEDEKTVFRDKSLDEKKRPLIWGKREVKKYTKRLKKG